MTKVKDSRSKQRLQWPTRKQWEEISATGGAGAWPSVHLKDYASPAEIDEALAELAKLRQVLHRAGRKEERRIVMELIACFRDGMAPDGDYVDLERLDRVDYLFPPVVLNILSRRDATEKFALEVYARSVDDEAWAAELRRRRRAEG